MSGVFLDGLFRVFGRTASVPISACVHYGAFRYGRREPHPYETYQSLVVGGRDRDAARKWFVDFVRYYRPKHLGESLGIDLEREYALWHLPWSRTVPTGSGWHEDPDECVDIVTHFSARGVLWFRIEQEFFWLERPVYSIGKFGWDPVRYGGTIRARKLVRRDGSECYLLLDGNHRVGALAALGKTTVRLEYLPFSVVREDRLSTWPQVRSGAFSATDAHKVFNAYFDGNPRWRVATQPAALLEIPKLSFD